MGTATGSGPLLGMRVEIPAGTAWGGEVQEMRDRQRGGGPGPAIRDFWKSEPLASIWRPSTSEGKGNESNPLPVL